MGCKNCKDKKNLIEKIDKHGTGIKLIWSIIGMTIIIVPWIIGASKLFTDLKEFIVSLF